MVSTYVQLEVQTVGTDHLLSRRDEFQPGELWSRVVAMEVKNSVKGGSPWVEWLSQDCLAQFDKLHARSLLGTSGSLSDSQ